MQPFQIPLKLKPSSYEAPRLRLHVLRSVEPPADLWSCLVSALRQARDSSTINRKSTAETLRSWAFTWQGRETTPEEKIWFDQLVRLVVALINIEDPWPLSVEVQAKVAVDVTPAWPEASYYIPLLLEDANEDVAPAQIRRVQVPVVFIPGREDTDPPTVALLELRLVSGGNGLWVHPADRWRRDVSITIKYKMKARSAGPGLETGGTELTTTTLIAGPAQPDFIASIAGAVTLARDHLVKTGASPRDGTIFWRLLDINKPTQPCDLNGVLQGPSAGGAALRAALHLLGPGIEKIAPRVFVLAQLGMDAGGQPNGTLEAVKGESAKMIALSKSLTDSKPGHRAHALVVLAHALAASELPPELDPGELYPQPVKTVADLTHSFRAREENRVRLGHIPAVVVGLGRGHKNIQFIVLLVVVLVAIGGVWLYKNQEEALATIKKEMLGPLNPGGGKLEFQLMAQSDELAAKGDYLGAAKILSSAVDDDPNLTSEEDARLSIKLASMYTEIAYRNPARQALQYIEKALVQLRFANTPLDDPIPTGLLAGIRLNVAEILRVKSEYLSGQARHQLLNQAQNEMVTVERMPGKSAQLEELMEAQALIINSDLGLTLNDPPPAGQAMLNIMGGLVIAKLGSKPHIADAHLHATLRIKLAQIAVREGVDIDHVTVMRYLDAPNPSGLKYSDLDSMLLKLNRAICLNKNAEATGNMDELDQGMGQIHEALGFFTKMSFLRFEDEARYQLAKARLGRIKIAPSHQSARSLGETIQAFLELKTKAQTMPVIYTPMIEEDLAECHTLSARNTALPQKIRKESAARAIAFFESAKDEYRAAGMDNDVSRLDEYLNEVKTSLAELIQ